MNLIKIISLILSYLHKLHWSLLVLDGNQFGMPPHNDAPSETLGLFVRRISDEAADNELEDVL